MRSDMSSSAIGNFMSGKRGLSLNSADKILGAFGLEIKIGKIKKEGDARQ